MGFDHLTSLIDEHDFLDWVHLEEPLIDAAQLESQKDALVPLPESLDQFRDCVSLPQALPLKDFHFEDIDFDSITWENSLPATFYEDVLEDAVPLNTTTNFNALIHDNNALNDPNGINKGNGGATPKWDEERVIERRTNGRSKLSEMGFEDIRSYFYMPITRAAKEMNVGLTVLKKRCRELGIPRWPHRKMKSLKSLIHNVNELGKGVAGNDCITCELEILEAQKRLMEEKPEIQLTERTKKLRQACFKANYKKRRAMQGPYLYHHRITFS